MNCRYLPAFADVTPHCRSKLLSPRCGCEPDGVIGSPVASIRYCCEHVGRAVRVNLRAGQGNASNVRFFVPVTRLCRKARDASNLRDVRA